MFQEDEKLPQAHKSDFFFHSSFIVKCRRQFPKTTQISSKGWMSAICSDFALILGNVCEHVFSLFLIPSLILTVLWLSTMTT